jgi:hypothetical protein
MCAIRMFWTVWRLLESAVWGGRMKIPSQNLLRMALSVIQKQTFEYYAFTGRSNSDIGTLNATYAAPATVQGSVQPVPRRLFEQLGLDLQRNYSYFFVPQAVLDIDRGVSGDQFIYNNQTWQALSTTQWAGVDGWDQVLCVQVPNASYFVTSESGFALANEAGQLIVQE